MDFAQLENDQINMLGSVASIVSQQMHLNSVRLRRRGMWDFRGSVWNPNCVRVVTVKLRSAVLRALNFPVPSYEAVN